MGNNMIAFEEVSLYKIKRNFLLASFALTGFGHHFMGFSLPLEYSTVMIFIVLGLQIISDTLTYPKFLFNIIIFIFFQTFVLNPSNFSDFRVWYHFIAFIVIGFSLFSFVSFYQNNLYDFVKVYYKLVYSISLFSIFQIVIFLLFGISIIPQNLITGQFQTGSSVFIPEVLGILPRSFGLSSEPANFAYILIPGVYLALSQLLTKETIISQSKRDAWVILISISLTFSLVAYAGLIFSLLFILRNKIFKNFKGFTYSIIIISIAIYSVSLTVAGDKLSSFLIMSNEVYGNRIETRSSTSFALISNFMVAVKSQKENHFIGSGMNTHLYSYDKHIYNIFEYDQVLLEVNKEGAGSIFIRLLSEFGLPGLLGFIIFLIRYRIRNSGSDPLLRRINEMALITVLLVCLRSEHYISIFFLVFGAIYYFSYKLNKKPGYRVIA